MTLSVITICYNNLAGLKRTYGSLQKDIQSFEWVIIDGASQDGTFDFVKNDIQKNNENIIFLSEPDRGIYDAMNKGISLSTSEYLLFLNAGDTLMYPIFNILQLKNFSDVNVFGITKIDKFNKQVKWNGLSNTPSMLEKVPIPHQSSIIKKKVFMEMGLYDLQYKLLADHDFFSKAYINGYTFKFYNDILLIAFYLDGISSKLDHSLVILKELDTLQLKNFRNRLSWNIRLRYYYKYILSFFPFSETLMTLSRNIFFTKYK